MIRCALLALATLTACAPPPEVASRLPAIEEDLPYPDLVPLAPLLDDLPETAQSPTTLDARASRLRVRAAALRAAQL